MLTKLSAFVRYASFPLHTEAVTCPNADGTFDIYINDRLSLCKQQAAIKHELNHIEQDHLYNDIKEIETIEAEADLALVFN